MPPDGFLNDATIHPDEVSWAQLQVSGPLTSFVSGAAELRAVCGTLPPGSTVVVGYAGRVRPTAAPSAGGCVVAVSAVDETIKVLDADRQVVQTVDRDRLLRADFPLVCSAVLLAAAADDGLSPRAVLDRVLRASTSVGRA